jgi:hypothetical protein
MYVGWVDGLGFPLTIREHVLIIVQSKNLLGFVK